MIVIKEMVYIGANDSHASFNDEMTALFTGRLFGFKIRTFVTLVCCKLLG